VNYLGDGRVLKGAPSTTKEKTGGYIIRCQVLPSADRIRAADLPKSWALSDSHDLMASNCRWAEVSGLGALPQQVKTCLSHQKGESPIYRDFGGRFAEYYSLLSGSPWFERYLKLEVIRQAAIPYIDTINKRQFTPFLCVEGREELRTVLDFLREGDVLMVTRIDQLAPGIGDLQDIVRAIRARGASLKATEQPIDTSTAAGKCFLDMLGVLFETNLRRGRQLEGIEGQGRGRLRGRPASIDAAQVRAMKAQGLRASEISKRSRSAGRRSIGFRSRSGRRVHRAPVRCHEVLPHRSPVSWR
jgi:hypothetical protein